MPNRDETGPRGKGPETGRGLGPCAELVKNTDDKPLRSGLGRGRGGKGRGLGLGRGRGLGRNS